MYKTGDLIVGQFEVRHSLSGGMADVYIVFDQVSEKIFAAKMLKAELIDQPNAAQRFEREARLWINLGRHQHIVAAISFLRAERPFLLLDYVDGPTLQTLLNSEPGGLSLPAALAFGIQMSRGLAFAHQSPGSGARHRVIHRDLKPSNVMITRGCTAQLTDFGLAREQLDSTLTKGVIGTPHYMPYEQWRDSYLVTVQSDIFSLGVMLYEMLAGRRPFPGPSTAELFYQITNDKPEPLGALLPEIDPELEKLVMCCLRRRPFDRPESADAVAAELEAIQARLLQAGSAPAIPACAECEYLPKHEFLRCPICGIEPQTVAPPVERKCSCGSTVSEEHRFCIQCGLPYSLFCQHCGSSIPQDFRFCSNCGSSLHV